MLYITINNGQYLSDHLTDHDGYCPLFYNISDMMLLVILIVI